MLQAIKLKNQENSKKLKTKSKTWTSKKIKSQSTTYIFLKYGGTPVFSIVLWFFLLLDSGFCCLLFFLLFEFHGLWSQIENSMLPVSVGIFGIPAGCSCWSSLLRHLITSWRPDACLCMSDQHQAGKQKTIVKYKNTTEIKATCAVLMKSKVNKMGLEQD